MLERERLFKELREYENAKDEISQLSLRVTRMSKAIVYSAIRDDWGSAEEALRSLEAEAEKLRSLASRWPMFYGIAAHGLQEYVEAAVVYSFLRHSRLPSREELGVDVYTYLMGVGDAAGELSRKATEELLRGGVEAASRLRDAVEKLYLSMLSLEPRDYDLRRKVDYVASQANWITEKLFYAVACRSLRAPQEAAEAGGKQGE
uniref:Haloacid dehalogenase n=1 Tax=Thermofilum pendens TaxID=2269 RepID=A0A7C3WNX1_THEPE